MMHRVLIVDAVRAVRMLLAQMIQGHGDVPVEAETAEAALGKALENPPDAIIVNHCLDGRSGADLVREIRAANSDKLRSVPIVALSGRRGTERTLLDAGASCFLTKPYCEAELMKAVNWAIEVYGTRA
jgi:CheY-like chemotaxis protein